MIALLFGLRVPFAPFAVKLFGVPLHHTELKFLNRKDRKVDAKFAKSHVPWQNKTRAEARVPC